MSKTARILNITRSTMRRACDSVLEDLSREPLNSPTRTASHFEELIVKEAQKTVSSAYAKVVKK